MPPKKEVAPARPSDVEVFLARRLIDMNGEVGISSNAMLAEAIVGEPVRESDYPHDVSDLARCCLTFARAPGELKESMLPRFADYCHHLDKKLHP